MFVSNLARQQPDAREPNRQVAMPMIENLGNLGDFIGGIAVVVTLIYLAMQIRQNTRTVRLSSVQQVMGTSVAIHEAASSGPVPGILAKLEKKETLTDEEFAQFLLHIWAMLTHHWQLFHQHQNRMIDDDTFDIYMVRLQLVMATSLSRALWQSRLKNGFPVDFQECVEKQITDIA
jgi:hypothetical protein